MPIIGLDNRVFDYISYREEINPWLKEFFLSMLDATIDAHPDNAEFNYRSLLYGESIYTLEARRVADIDYFINFLTIKGLLSPKIFSDNIRDDYLKNLSACSSIMVDELKNKVDRLKEENSVLKNQKENAKLHFDQTKASFEGWEFPPERKKALFGLQEMEYKQAEERFEKNKNDLNEAKIKLEKITIQYNLMSSSYMRSFSQDLNKKIEAVTSLRPRRVLIPIDPLLSEKLFDLKTYTEGTILWPKTFVENIVKKSLRKRPFGFSSNYKTLLVDMLNLKEKGSGSILNNLIVNTLLIKLKLQRGSLIEHSEIAEEQKSLLELSGDNPVFKGLVNDIASELTATHFINNYPIRQRVNTKIQLTIEALEQQWLVSALAPHYSGRNSYRLFYGNLGLSWVKKSALTEKELIVDVLAEESGIDVLRDLFKEVGTAKRLLVQNLEDLITFFTRLPRDKQEKGFKFLEFMECPIEAILNEALNSDFNVIFQLNQLIDLFSESSRQIFMSKYRNEIQPFLKNIFLTFIRNLTKGQQKITYVNSDFFYKDSDSIKKLLSATQLAGDVDFSFIRKVTIGELFVLYELGVKNFTQIQLIGNFPEDLKEKPLKDIDLSIENFFYLLEYGYRRFNAKNINTIIDKFQRKFVPGETRHWMASAKYLSNSTVLGNENIFQKYFEVDKPLTRYWSMDFNWGVAKHVLNEKVYGLSINYKELLIRLSGYLISEERAEKYLLYAAHTDLDFPLPSTISDEFEDLDRVNSNQLRRLKNEYIQVVRHRIMLTQQIIFLRENSPKKNSEDHDLLKQINVGMLVGLEALENDFTSLDEDCFIKLAEFADSSFGRSYSVNGLNYRIYDENFALSWFQLKKISQPTTFQSNFLRIRFVNAISNPAIFLFLINYFPTEHVGKLIQTVDDLYLFFVNVPNDLRHDAFEWIIDNVSINQIVSKNLYLTSEQNEHEVQDFLLPSKLLETLKLLPEEDRVRFVTQGSECIKAVLRSLFASLDLKRRFREIEAFQGMHYEQYDLIDKENLYISRELIQTLVDSGYTDFSELTIPSYPLGYGPLDGLNLSHSDFSYSHLKTSIFGTNFTDTVLDNTNFYGTLFQINFSSSNLQDTLFKDNKIILSSMMLNSLAPLDLKSTQFSTRSFSELLMNAEGDELFLEDANLNEVDFYQPIIQKELKKFTKITFPSYLNLPESAYSFKFSSNQVIVIKNKAYHSNLNQQSTLKKWEAFFNNDINKPQIKFFHTLSMDTKEIHELFFISCKYNKEEVFIANMNIVHELNERKKITKLTLDDTKGLELFYKSINEQKEKLSRSKRNIKSIYQDASKIRLDDCLNARGKANLEYTSLDRLFQDIKALPSKTFVTISSANEEVFTKGTTYAIYKNLEGYNSLVVLPKDAIGFNWKSYDIASLKKTIGEGLSEDNPSKIYVYAEKKHRAHTEIKHEFLSPLTRAPMYLMALDAKLGGLKINDQTVSRMDLFALGLEVKDSKGEWWPIDGNSLKSQLEFDMLRREQRLQVDAYTYDFISSETLKKGNYLKNDKILSLVGKDLPLSYADPDTSNKIRNRLPRLDSYLKKSGYSKYNWYPLDTLQQLGRWRITASMSTRERNYVIAGNSFILAKSGYASINGFFDGDFLEAGLAGAEFFLTLKQPDTLKWVTKCINQVRGKWFTTNGRMVTSSVVSGVIGLFADIIELVIAIDGHADEIQKVHEIQASRLEKDRLQFQIVTSGYSVASNTLLFFSSIKFPRFAAMGGVTNEVLIHVIQSGINIHYALEKYKSLNLSVKEKGNVGLNILFLLSIPSSVQEILAEQTLLEKLAMYAWEEVTLDPKIVMSVHSIGKKQTYRPKRGIILAGRIKPEWDASRSIGSYLNRKSVDAKIDLREGQNKQAIYLSRIALDPDRLSSNATLTCSPGFRSIEPEGTGKLARDERFASSNMQCVGDKEKLETLPAGEGMVLINSALIDGGEIIGSDRWGNVIKINSDSQVVIHGGGNSFSEYKENHFIYKNKKFSGALYGGVSLDSNRKVKNILDMRSLDVEKVIFKNNTLELDGKSITAQGMNYYFGLEGAVQQIDCSHMPLDFVSMYGVDKGTHLLTNCKFAELYTNTQVTSSLTGIHAYSIQFGQGDILIDASHAERINLIFSPDCDLLSSQRTVNFYFHPIENSFEVTFVKYFKTLRVKSTYLDKEGKPKLDIFVGDKQLSVNFGDLSEIRKTSNPVSALSIQQIKIDSSLDAMSLEKFYGSMTKKHRITTKILEKISNSASAAIVASAFKDFILVDNPEEKITYYGGDGADIYQIDPNLAGIVINNFAEDKLVDELNFSDTDLSEFVLQSRGQHLIVQCQSRELLKVYNYFQKKEYQHIYFKNSWQSRIILKKENTLQLIPYFRFQEQGPLINVNKAGVMQQPDVAIDTNLENLNAFRKRYDLILITNPNYRKLRKENYFISIRFIDYYLDPKAFDTLTLWGAPEGELIKANESNKFDKSTLANFAMLALDWQLLENQAFTKYSVSVHRFFEEIHHNQESLNDNYFTVHDQEKKAGLIELVDFEMKDAANIVLEKQGEDLVFNFLNQTHNPWKKLVIKNWDEDPSHRIDSLQFADNFVVKDLSLYSLEALSGMRQQIDNAILIHLVQAEIVKNITLEAFEDLKVLLYFRALQNVISSYSYLGFHSPIEEKNRIYSYFIQHGTKIESFKRLESFFCRRSGKKRIKALIWYAIGVYLSLNAKPAQVKDFFDLIPAHVFDLFLPTLMDKTKPIARRLDYIKNNLPFFSGEIQGLLQQAFPQWLNNITQLLDETGEDQAPPLPLVGENRMNVHSLAALYELTNNSQKEERDWFQTMGDWIHENSHTLLVSAAVVGVGVVLGGAIYGVRNLDLSAALYRRVIAILGYSAVSTVAQAQEGPVTPNLRLPNSDFKTYTSDNRNKYIKIRVDSAQIVNFEGEIYFTSPSNTIGKEEKPITECIIHDLQLLGERLRLATCRSERSEVKVFYYEPEGKENNLITSFMERNAKNIHSQAIFRAKAPYHDAIRANFAGIDNLLYLLIYAVNRYQKYKEKKWEKPIIEELESIPLEKQREWKALLDKSKQMLNALAELQREKEREVQEKEEASDKEGSGVLFRFIQKNVIDVLFPKPPTALALLLKALESVLHSHQEVLTSFVEQKIVTHEEIKMMTERCEALYEEVFFSLLDSHPEELAPLVQQKVVTETDIEIMLEKREAFPSVPSFSIEGEDESAGFLGHEPNWLRHATGEGAALENSWSSRSQPLLRKHTQKEMIAREG